MKTLIRVRYDDGETGELIVRGPAEVGDRVQSYASMIEATVVEVVGLVE